MPVSQDSLLRKTSIALPAAVCFIVIGQAIHFGWHLRLALSWAYLVFMAVYLAWFLNRRSHDQEAAFFSTRIRPSDNDRRKSSADYMALLSAPFLVVLTLALPWLVRQ